MAHIQNEAGKIIIKAMLTRAGRQKLASGVDNFNITKFAVADDQINYNIEGLKETLESTPQNYKILQPILNGQLMMNHKLYSATQILEINQEAQVILPDLPFVGNVIRSGTGTITYSPQTTDVGITQNYNIRIQTLNSKIPFEKIEVTNGPRNTRTIAYQFANNLSNISIQNVHTIILHKRPMYSTINFIMTITGVKSGISANYQFEVEPQQTIEL